MRRFTTAGFVLLAIAALFLGNCFSCPQLMAQDLSHGCCHRTKIKCDSQGIKHFVKSDMQAESAPAVVADVPRAPELLVLAVAEEAPSIFSPHRPPLSPLRV